MALRGTMKDFALPDIFQLIGIQRKTGLLTLVNDDDTVTLKFLNGEVVGADTKSATLEHRLGELLVRTGRIAETQLREALRIQKNTLQRLGYILVNAGHISEEHLVEALRVQSSQIIYRLFRWHEGTYHFDPVEDLEYDQNHFTPISSETILMEGARMIDEWPIIERRIKSDKVILRKTEALQALNSEVDSILDEDMDFNLDLGGENEAAPAPEKSSGPTLSPEERAILALVDGKRTVGEICDLVNFGEFDTHRILSDVVTRHLLEVVGPETPRVPDSRWGDIAGRILTRLAQVLMALLVVASLASLKTNPLTPGQLLAADPATDQLRYYASMARLEKIQNAIQVFYLDTGTFPKSTSVLAQNGYLTVEDLEDPWGRPYSFQIASGGYLLSGTDAEGEPNPDLTVQRRFNAVQNMMAAPRNIPQSLDPPQHVRLRTTHLWPVQDPNPNTVNHLQPWSAPPGGLDRPQRAS